jgi:hypothetical protein
MSFAVTGSAFDPAETEREVLAGQWDWWLEGVEREFEFLTTLGWVLDWLWPVNSYIQISYRRGPLKLTVWCERRGNVHEPPLRQSCELSIETTSHGWVGRGFSDVLAERLPGEDWSSPRTPQSREDVQAMLQQWGRGARRLWAPGELDRVDPGVGSDRGRNGPDRVANDLPSEPIDATTALKWARAGYYGWWFTAVSDEFAFLMQSGWRIDDVEEHFRGCYIRYGRAPLQLTVEKAEVDSLVTWCRLEVGKLANGWPHIREFSDVLAEHFPDVDWSTPKKPESGAQVLAMLHLWGEGARKLWGGPSSD